MAFAAVLRYLLRPLAGPPLLLNVVVSLLLAVANAAGLVGLPLVGLLASWVGTYAFLLVDYTAHGRPPPVLALEMTVPWHEPRPLLLVVLLGATAGVVWWLRLHGADGGAIAIAVSVLALFPASLALLAVEGNLLRALWPPALFAI